MKYLWAILFALLIGCNICAYEITPDACSRAVEQAERLVGNNLEMRFSLSLGRIVWFGEKGENLLWLNNDREIAEYHEKFPAGYLNFGGDKVWATPQCLWSTIFEHSWPPPIALEGLPWKTVRKTARSLIVESQPIPILNIQLVRTFILPDDAPVLIVKNTVKRISSSPYPIQLWSITQLKNPAFCVEEIQEATKGLPPYIIYNNRLYSKPIAKRKLLRQSICPEERGAKSGTLGRFVAAVYPDSKILLQVHAVHPSGCYPEGASVQVHTNPYYSELETLGELYHLRPGETHENQVIWVLLSGEKAAHEENELYSKLTSEIEKIYVRFFRKSKESSVLLR